MGVVTFSKKHEHDLIASTSVFVDLLERRHETQSEQHCSGMAVVQLTKISRHE